MWCSNPTVGLMDYPKESNDNWWESVDEIVNHGSAFNTFGVAQLLLLGNHRQPPAAINMEEPHPVPPHGKVPSDSPMGERLNSANW